MVGDLYSVDPAASRFTVQAFATGLLAKLGHSPTLLIRDYTGEARLAPAPSIFIRIRAASLAVTGRVSDKDRSEIERAMNAEVLESGRYPEIIFRSTKVSLEKHQATVSGELTLHGITRTQTLTAQFAVVGESLRAQGDFTVLQSAYNIRPVRVAGGTLRLKDEVRCSFELMARRKAEPVEGAA